MNNLRRRLPHLAELILAASGSFAVVLAPLMGKGEVGSKYVCILEFGCFASQTALLKG